MHNNYRVTFTVKMQEVKSGYVSWSNPDREAQVSIDVPETIIPALDFGNVFQELWKVALNDLHAKLENKDEEENES